MKLLKPWKELNSGRCYEARPLGARVGVMLHFDGSKGEDRFAVEWFTAKKCRVSYNRLYLDDGRVVQITPTMEHAAWHAGECFEPNANRRYYGLALATDEDTPATEKATGSLIHDCAALFTLNGWSADQVSRRIVGHEDQAKPKGRKIDPTGVLETPILSTADVRARVAELLRGSATVRS